MLTKRQASELQRMYTAPRTDAERFLAACKARREALGGRPVASLDPVTGRCVMTYPDGTVVGAGALRSRPAV